MRMRLAAVAALATGLLFAVAVIDQATARGGFGGMGGAHFSGGMGGAHFGGMGGPHFAHVGGPHVGNWHGGHLAYNGGWQAERHWNGGPAVWHGGAPLGMTMSILTTSTIITTSITALWLWALAGGQGTTIMGMAMADADGSIAVLWSQVAHIGGTSIMLAPLTSDVSR